MLTTCQECGVLFKTDNPKRKTCYDCRAELQFTVQFPDAIQLPQKNRKRQAQITKFL